MDNYFKNFRDSEEIILKYNITNNKIIIYTIKNQKRIKRKLELTKKNIKECETKLEQQYKNAINDKIRIIECKKEQKNNIYIFLSMAICILSAISSIFLESLGIFLCITSISTLIVNLIDIHIYNKKIYEQFKIYSEFLKKQNNIEECYKERSEVINHIDQKTTKILNQNIKLKEQDLINHIFNIDFMDKASLQSLKQILKNYMDIEKNKVRTKTKDK